jgi:hypothetical protein
VSTNFLTLVLLSDYLKSMRKPQVCTSVDAEIADRLSDLAKVDNRSLAQMTALAIAYGLPELEREHAEKLAHLHAKELIDENPLIKLPKTRPSKIIV